MKRLIILQLASRLRCRVRFVRRRRARGRRHQGQADIHSGRLFRVPRARGAGRGCRSQTRARSLAIRRARKLRANHVPSDAAVQHKILSDDDLADIYAYLQSIPKPPDPKNIPALSP